MPIKKKDKDKVCGEGEEPVYVREACVVRGRMYAEGLPRIYAHVRCKVGSVMIL